MTAPLTDDERQAVEEFCDSLAQRMLGHRPPRTHSERRLWLLVWLGDIDAARRIIRRLLEETDE